MRNLYETITSLVKERESLLRQDHRIANYAHFGKMKGKAEFKKNVLRYIQIDEQLKKLEKDYSVNIIKMGKIISKNMGETYIPKIFYQYDGRCYYGFAGCYVNKNSKYYTNPSYEIDVSPEEYANIVCDNKKYILFSYTCPGPSDKPHSPKEFYDSINFIELYTREYHQYITYHFSSVFIQSIKPMLRKELESIEVASVDENFDQGL